MTKTKHPDTRLQRRKLKSKNEKEEQRKAGKVRKRLKSSIEEKETTYEVELAKRGDLNLLI